MDPGPQRGRCAIDAGWLFVIAGLVMCSAIILIPAQLDRETVRHELRKLEAEEAGLANRLGAYARFIDDLDKGDGELVRRLAAQQLNLAPEGDEPIVLAVSSQSSISDWVEASVRPVDRAEAATMSTPSLLTRLATGPRRLWIVGMSMFCVFAGLIMTPTRPRPARVEATDDDVLESRLVVIGDVAEVDVLDDVHEIDELDDIDEHDEVDEHEAAVDELDEIDEPEADEEAEAAVEIIETTPDEKAALVAIEEEPVVVGDAIDQVTTWTLTTSVREDQQEIADAEPVDEAAETTLAAQIECEPAEPEPEQLPLAALEDEAAVLDETPTVCVGEPVVEADDELDYDEFSVALAAADDEWEIEEGLLFADTDGAGDPVADSVTDTDTDRVEDAASPVPSPARGEG